MAIQTSPLFAGFRGSVNRHLLFRQCGGKTVFSKFPNRSKVIYSEQQKQVQKRFSEAIDFARVVIKEPGLKNIYSIKASLLGFRSAWNLAIAEFMSEKPLEVKKKKIWFDKSILVRSLRWNIPVKLYKFAEEADQEILKFPKRLRSSPRRAGFQVNHLKYLNYTGKIVTSPIPASKPESPQFLSNTCHGGESRDPIS